MKTYFIDLDGTIFRHGTNDFLPGAIRWLQSLEGAIVWCTRRGDEFGDHPVYGNGGLMVAMGLLAPLKLKVIGMISNCGSPRILVNDEEASVISHATNTGWDESCRE